MPRYAILNNETGAAGVVLNIAIAEEALHPGWISNPPTDVGVGHFYDGNGNYTAPTVVPPPRIVTQFAFRNRFTFEERVAIETAATSTPAVRVLLADQNAAQFIDLDDETTIQGISYLVSAGLVDAARGELILSAPVQDKER